MLRIRLVSSTRDQVSRIIEHLSQAVGFEVLRAPSEGADKGDYSSGAISLGGGGVILEASELPNLACTARRLAKKRPISRLVSVDIADASTASGAIPVPLPYTLTDMAKWVLEDRPLVIPALSVSSSMSHQQHSHGIAIDASTSISDVSPPVSDDGVGIRGLHEVVLSYGDDTASSTRMHEAMSTVGEQVLPNVWRVPCRSYGGSVAFRLLPSSLSALIVGVEDLDLARETLRKRGVPHESIGVTGASHGQLMLSSPILTGLDVRLCQYDTEPLTFFNEGTEVMMDGALDELNPAIVRATSDGETRQDGRGRVEYKNMETDGHCWTEFHANLKNPSGWLKKRPAVRKG